MIRGPRQRVRCVSAAASPTIPGRRDQGPRGPESAMPRLCRLLLTVSLLLPAAGCWQRPNPVVPGQTGSQGQPSPADGQDHTAAAVRAVRQLGAQVEPAEGAPTKVRLQGRPLTEADLAPLRDLPELQEVQLL